MTDTHPRSQGAHNAHAAQVFIDALAAAGVRRWVISPGGRSIPLVLALRARRELTLHRVLDERSAGFFALGLVRATSEPVGLLCTSGSAGAHYLPALLEARHARLPLVVLTADRPPQLRNWGAPQTVHQPSFFAGCAVRVVELSVPGPHLTAPGLAWEAHRGVSEAVRLGGPVHFNFPFAEPLWDEAAEVSRPAEAGPQPRIWLPEARPGAHWDPQRMGLGPRGLIVLGPGAVRSPQDAEALLLASHRRGWPILSEPSSGLRFVPPVLKAYDLLLPMADVPQPDVVVRVGAVPAWRSTREALGRLGQGKTILIDPFGDHHDPAWEASVHLQAPVHGVARWLSEQSLGVDPGWAARWQRADEAAQRVVEQSCAPDSDVGLIRALIDLLPDGAPLWVGSSLPIRDVGGFVFRSRPLALHANRGVNGIDGNLASAAGVAAALNEPVTVLVGDLTFFHDAGALDALGERLRVVVVDNGGGNIFRQLPIAKHPEAFEPDFLTPQGQALPADVVVSHVDDLPRALEGGGRVIALRVNGARCAQHRAELLARVREVEPFALTPNGFSRRPSEGSPWTPSLPAQP